MRPIYVATEDEVSEAVAERLIDHANSGLVVEVRMRRGGNDYLKGKLPELAKLARTFPVFLLTDLDRLACPSALINGWRGGIPLPNGLVFRVAVREVEAWLLADHRGFAELSGVPVHRVPDDPEMLLDPKEALIAVVRRYGARQIKGKILPDRGSTAAVGPGYTAELSAFARDAWDPVRAAERSPSLARALQRLIEL